MPLVIDIVLSAKTQLKPDRCEFEGLRVPSVRPWHPFPQTPAMPVGSMEIQLGLDLLL